MPRYGLTGQLTGVLADGERSADAYSVVWDGRDEGGPAMASAAYMYRLERDARAAQTKRMVLLK